VSVKTSDQRSLLEHRLVIVTGKGGTGKTTVSAALALAGAQAGLRVLIVEMGPDEQIPRLLDPRAPRAGYVGFPILPGLRVMQIDPFEALAEYLGLQLGVRAIVDVVVRNKAFRQLMTAAPGWRELITLGKIWHLAQLDSDDSPGRRFDLIVVDAPATGHGVAFLDVPRVVISAVRAGPLHAHAQRVEDMLEDPNQTLVLPVALAEELPAREIAELTGRVRDEMGISVDRVIVNAVVGPPFPDAIPDLDEALARLDGDLELGALPPPRELARCAHYLRSRHELNRRFTTEIQQTTGLPTVELPRLREGIQGRDQIASLMNALLANPVFLE
jgi:anion-transporting  ArsA/GET3 family ATPase